MPRLNYFTIVALVSIMLIALQASAYELNPEIYLNEFNNKNETCNYKDAFFYTTSSNTLSFNTMYSCCRDNSSCLVLPFDILNKKVYGGNDEVEIFHISYTRQAIKEGNIKPENYYPQSVDICNYFGEKFGEQATSLGVEAGETFAPEKYKQTFKIIKNAGHATGLISEFDIGIFFLSITCRKMSKVEEAAFLKVGECYQSIKSIESGTTHYGQTSEIISCNEQSKAMLKEILDSWEQQLKNIANTIVSVGKAFFWDPIMNILKGSTEMPTFKVTPTTYEIVQQTYNKISSENTFFKNPNATDLSNRAIIRFNEKYNESTSIYYPLLEKYNSVKLNVSGRFSEVALNIFLKPNSHQSKEREILSSIEGNLSLMADLINEGRYNSAIALGTNISMQFQNLNMAIANNPVPIQKLDYLTIFFILVLLVAIFYAVYRFSI